MIELRLELATVICRVLNAARSHDQTQIAHLLDEALERFGADGVVDGVALPALRLIRLLVAGGSADASHARLLSVGTDQWVRGHLAPVPSWRDAVLLLTTTTADQDLQELRCLELLLRGRAVRVVNLDARTSLAAIRKVLIEAPATAAVIHAQHHRESRDAVRTVKLVAAWGVPVYYLGAAFAPHHLRAGLPGRALDDGLGDAASLLAARHTRDQLAS